jgi:hypothetical protein
MSKYFVFLKMSIFTKGLRSIFNTSLKFHPISLATDPKILGTGALVGSGMQMAIYTNERSCAYLTYPEKFVSTSAMGFVGACTGLITIFVVSATYPIIITAAIISVAIK